MKALMFGWEFPPHILGGLGTASYGLTKGMSQQPDMQIITLKRSMTTDSTGISVKLAAIRKI